MYWDRCLCSGIACSGRRSDTEWKFQGGSEGPEAADEKVKSRAERRERERERRRERERERERERVKAWRRQSCTRVRLRELFFESCSLHPCTASLAKSLRHGDVTHRSLSTFFPSASATGSRDRWRRECLRNFWLQRGGARLSGRQPVPFQLQLEPSVAQFCWRSEVG